jgi:hypothetical protein
VLRNAKRFIYVAVSGHAKKHPAMKKTNLIFWILIFTNIIAKGQIISGLITDENNNPLPFVNIGIVDKNKGTVSTDKGEFQINITNLDKNAILRFSSVGFETYNVQVNDLRKKIGQKLHITLTSKTYNLDEVLIKANQVNTFFIGSKKSGKTSWAWYNLMNGAEIGRLVKNRDEIALHDFLFHISETNCDSILYRVKIYSIDNELPDTIINSKEIFFMSSINHGWENIDLREYGIIIKNDFIVTLETIQGWGKEDKKEIFLSKIQNSGISYKRLSSWAPWLKFTGEMSYKLNVSKINP